MSALPTAGASREVLEHHWRSHRCPDDTQGISGICPCGPAVAFVCDGCGQPVFLAVVDPAAPCVHALELREAL